MRLGDSDQLNKLILAVRLMRPYVLSIVKKLAHNKVNALLVPKLVDLPRTLVLVIFEVQLQSKAVYDVELHSD